MKFMFNSIYHKFIYKIFNIINNNNDIIIKNIFQILFFQYLCLDNNKKNE